jgi:hypothetical protein
MVGNFKVDEVDRVPMRPTQGFEPVVSVFGWYIRSFRLFLDSADLVEADAQDLSALRETRPPVPEDRPAREARSQHASQKKQVKETAKKRQLRKAKEKEALKKLRRQQALNGVPLAESPSETVSGEDDDDSDDEDDDSLSWYEATTGLGDLPDIRPLLEPVGGSSCSVVVVEETEEEVEKEAGPSMGGAALSQTQ